ncbi:MAG: NAD(P)-binding protein [Halobacteriales archaeon]|nr:NAD(P)-binding protein [Halobacteriales archaeon]
MSKSRRTVHEPSSEMQAATHYVLGGGHVGTAIAERLYAAGHCVAIVDEGYESGPIPGHMGDPSDTELLAASGITNTSVIIVASPSDRRNLLIAQLVRTQFDVQRVVAFVNHPDRRPAFDDAGHEPFCVTTVLSETVGETI